ncbi:hypothetical protein PAPYR_3728 [Paratrimastix pyriformis]|uniref:TmcB/TmcC TPR repeats domain-containing protein n=1 Tax=Paratrimastix pyriformis TaxID=342808 RepID=A0ABQ8ULE4_9EUKA|nr:hypothetical protein PAPYR_3728 [Paratrimastix pyriformis]
MFQPGLGQREEFVARVERTLFSFFYVLKTDSPAPRLKSLLYFLQTFQLFFVVVAIPTCFHATEWVQIPLYIIDFSMGHLSPVVAYVSFGVCAGFTVLFALCAALIEIIHGDSASIAWPLRLLKGSNFLFSWVLLIPMMGSYLDILDCNYASHPPTHDIFPTLLCWSMPHVVPSVLALITLTLFLLVALGSALFAFPTTGFDTRSRGRVDLVVVCPSFQTSPLNSAIKLVCKCLIICASRVLTAHTVFRAVIVLATTALMLALVFLMLPYHLRIANLLYAGQYWVCLLAALEWSILNLALPQYADSWVPFVVLVGIAAITTPFVVWFTFWRYNSTLAMQRAAVLHVLSVKPPPPKAIGPGGGGVNRVITSSQGAAPPASTPAGSPDSAVTTTTSGEQSAVSSAAPTAPVAAPAASPIPAAKPRQTAYGLTPAQRFSAEAQTALGIPPPDKVMARCRWSWQVEWATRFLRWNDAAADPRLLNFVKVLYAKGMAKFPNSHGLLLNYAEFMQCFQHNPSASIALIRRATALPNSALDTRFSIYAAERLVETAGDGSSHAAGFMSALTFKRLMRQAEMNQTRARKRLARVWAFLMRPRYDMRGLTPLLDSAVAHANSALEAYSSLMQSFPSNVSLLRSYGTLLQDLYGDSELADGLFSQADQLEEEKTDTGDGSVHSSHGAVIKKPGQPAVTTGGPAAAPTMTRVPSIKSRLGESKLGDDAESGGLLDHRAVIRYLIRHSTDEEADDSAAGDSNEQEESTRPFHSVIGWLLLLLHLCTLGVLVLLLVTECTTLEDTILTTTMSRGNANCSLIVEKISYEARKMLEVLLEARSTADDPVVANVTFGPAAEGELWALSARMFAFANQLAELILATGAKGSFQVPWMTWMSPVVIPVVTDGALTTMIFNQMSLWGFSMDFANKARHLGLIEPNELKSGRPPAFFPFSWIHSELLYLVVNGPLVLAQALTNMSITMARTHGSDDSTMYGMPIYAAVLAAIFCALGTTLTVFGLHRVSRGRRTVLAYFFNMPKELVQSEFARLQKKSDAELEESPSRQTLPSASLGLLPAMDGASRGRLETLSEVPSSLSSSAVPPSLPEGGDPTPQQSPSASVFPLLGDSSGTDSIMSFASHSAAAMMPVLPARSPAMGITGSASMPVLPLSGIDFSEPPEPADTSVRPSATITELLALVEEAGAPGPVGRAAKKYADAGSACEETVAVLDETQSAKSRDDEEEEANRRLRAKTSEEEKRAQEKERSLAKLWVLSCGLFTRVIVALLGVSLLIVCWGLIAPGQMGIVSSYSQEIAVYAAVSPACGARLTLVGVTSNLAYQLVHNNSLPYVPFASVTPSTDVRIKTLLESNPIYPAIKTNRALLRQLTQSLLANLTQLSRVTSYGGSYMGLTVSAGLGKTTEMDDLWFTVRKCWLYDHTRCHPGRLPGWPVNGTLNGLLETYQQAVGNLATMDDSGLSADTDWFALINAAWENDLPDGLDVISMSARNSYRAAVSGVENAAKILFGVCVAAMVLSYFFLFRVNLIKDEQIKTVHMRALLPKATFARTSKASICCMNVKTLDDLHWVTVSNINQTRNGLDNGRPISELIETYEPAVEALRQAQREEERLMRQYGMPRRKSHFLEHVTVMQAYEKPLNAMKEGQPDALVQLTALMRLRPLIPHILKVDASLGRFLNQRGHNVFLFSKGAFVAHTRT